MSNYRRSIRTIIVESLFWWFAIMGSFTLVLTVIAENWLLSFATVLLLVIGCALFGIIVSRLRE